MTTSTLLSRLLLAAALAVAVASSSFAQTTKGIGSSIEGGPGMKPTASPDQRINRLDKNKDGQISRDEASSHPKLLKGFDRIDVNKDGQLSRDELKAFHEKRQANRAAHGKPVKEPKAPKTPKAAKGDAPSTAPAAK
jgi:EF hand